MCYPVFLLVVYLAHYPGTPEFYPTYFFSFADDCHIFGALFFAHSVYIGARPFTLGTAVIATFQATTPSPISHTKLALTLLND